MKLSWQAKGWHINDHVDQYAGVKNIKVGTVVSVPQ